MIKKTVLPDGPRIKRLRRDKGDECTQEWLAEQTGWSKRVIEKAEAGKERVEKQLLEDIAEVLGVPVSDIIAPDPDAFVFTQEMLEAIPLPVFFKDEQGVYRGCNERFCTYIGRDREHVIGKTVFEVAPTGHAKIYKAKDDELFAKPGEQVYQTRVVANTVERRVLFFKGTFPVRGMPEGIIGVIVDITDYTGLTPELIDNK